MPLTILSKTFEKQLELIAPVENYVYVNELKRIKMFRTLPPQKNRLFDQLTQQLLDSLDLPRNIETCAEHSRFDREVGNEEYKRAKSNKNPREQADGLLSACRIYTFAILHAENAYDELCLCYANRGMALHDYGYYEQAYDDCECALEFGYPEKLQHKIIMRQAHCAWKLGNKSKLEEHVASLEMIELNENFRMQLKQLQDQLKLMQTTTEREHPATEKSKVVHEIITKPGEKGRCMIATKAIARGELIFTEQAECFVPIEKFICQQCAASLMCAPIPCPECHQRVVYCSRRCRQQHAQMHSYECEGYRMDLFRIIGSSHLAMRMVLTYLPGWLTQLQGCSNAEELWQALMSMTHKEDNCWADEPQSVQSLCMITHLDKMSLTKLYYHALSANVLQYYLHKYTNFFDQLMSESAATREDWHLIVAALILRSSGQVLANATVGDVVVPSLPDNEFVLLLPNIWSGPHSVKVGHLHKFCQMRLVASANLPYLALCNHACEPSIRIAFDGNSIRTYAARDIEPGEEIYNCYTVDYKNSTCLERRNQLKSCFQFLCNCKKCLRLNPDQDHDAFFTYRCESAKCGRTFVPKLQLNQTDRKWWIYPEKKNRVVCSVCKTPQQYQWFDEFMELLDHCRNTEKRRNLYKSFDKLKNWLIDYHFLRVQLARKLISRCLSLRTEGCLLNDFDYNQMGRIMKYLLPGFAAHFSNTIECIIPITFLWDLVALGKYKVNGSRLEATLSMVQKYLSGETKQVFLNYYNEFIEQQIK